MKKERHVYLKMKTLAEARKILLDSFTLTNVLQTEVVSVPEAVGRVLAEPVFATVSSPNFHAAAMDGIAVKAEITFGASQTTPKELIINQHAFYVNTGQVMPANTDAVIMIEHVNVLDDSRVEIDAPVYPWQHVRKVGEDIVATELLFPQNHVITPYCIGALLAGGVFSVPVKSKPKILIIPTGSEIVDWRQINAQDLLPGQVFDTNSDVLGKLVESVGGINKRHEIVIDDIEKIEQAVATAVDEGYHIILIVGGSSAGSEDYAKDVILKQGEVLVHGVTIMPGKPVVVGSMKQKPVIGIPGYPVSAIIAFEQFVQPLIAQMLGQAVPVKEIIDVEPTRKIASRLGVEEFIRVKLGKVGPRVVATPLPRGAGSITSLTEADGIIRIPNHVEGMKDHETVPAELLRPLSAIHNTIVIVGSHDNSLDVLRDCIKSKYGHLTLSSSHVGSMGGLMALKKGVCHLAGSHLLDSDDGSYNVSYVKKLLPNMPLKLVHLVLRDQGLIVKRGNPKIIHGIEGLTREDIRFINRQGGSGTRLLLDYKLKQLGLNPEGINGYHHEEFTHMSVAVAVLSDTVDTGLGIYAAAKALNLDFIPVVTEQYDLIIPEDHYHSENIQILLETMNSQTFKQRVKALGGYSTQRTGELIDID